MKISSMTRSIVTDIKRIHKDLGKLVHEFNKSSVLLQKKMQYLKEALETRDFPKLAPKLKHTVLEGLCLQELEEKLDMRMISEILKVIKSNADREELAQFEDIRNELKIFLTDLLEWRKIVLNQKKFIDENIDKILSTEYIIKHLMVLLENERDIIYKHGIANQGEKEAINHLSAEINKIFKEWKPSYLRSFTRKVITDPNDPELSRAYNELFKPMFPLDMMPFSDFQEILTDSAAGEFGKGRYRVIIIKNKEGKIIAGESFYFIEAEPMAKKLPAIAFGFDEYIAVLPEYRRYAIASEILAFRLKTLKKDAKRIGRPLSMILGEYHNEKKMTAMQLKKEGFNPIDRKRFWKRMGFKALGFDYHNPNVDDMRQIEKGVYTLGFWSPLKVYEHKVQPMVLLQMLRAIIENYYGKGERGKKGAFYANLMAHYRKIFTRMARYHQDIMIEELVT